MRLFWATGVIVCVILITLPIKRWLKGEEYAWLRVPQEPIRVPASFTSADRVPAVHGALAGANVLLITLDTTRAGRLANYGNQRIATPALDRIAAEGVLFSNALATAPTTLPSHASIMTGLYPVHHGARANGRFRLAEEHDTLAEILREQGYSTAAVVSAFVLDSRYGLAQGFEVYNDAMRADGFNQALGASERRAEITTTHALSWLSKVSAPFFLWVHYFDPHANYDPPKPFSAQYRRNLYDGEIAYVDAQIDRLLAHLDESGISERTLVVVAGDHGEGLAEHNELTHGYLLYDVTLKVPLILRGGPALGAGIHIADRVSVVDIAPTVLALLGIGPPSIIDGVDLTQPPPSDRRIFAETYHGWMEYGWAPLLSVHGDNFKYIHGPDPELYDLRADPFERQNIIGSNPEHAASLLADLERLFGHEVTSDSAITPNASMSNEELARLRALGYAFGGAGEDDNAVSRPDPKTRIELVNRIFEITCYYEPKGLLEESVRLLEDLADRFPDSYVVLFNLGNAYWKNSRLADAAGALAECVAMRPSAPEARHRLAQVHMEQNAYDEAIALLEQLAAEQPGNIDVHCDLATALAAVRRFREASGIIERAFLLDPTNRDALRLFVGISRRAGTADPMAQVLAGVLRDNPEIHGVRDALATQWVVMHRYADAEAILREGAILFPTEAAPRARFARFLVECPDESYRDPEQARHIVDQLGELAQERSPTALFDVAQTRAALDQIDLALDVAMRARTLAVEQERGDSQANIESFILKVRQMDSRGG
jgi:arylsulfatase A-like enzyme/tetratricopeptide (TPR) repeat protein